MRRCHALMHDLSHNVIPVNSVRQQLLRNEMVPCQVASIQTVSNGQVLNSMAVFKACTFLCLTKTLQLRLLLCCWHGSLLLQPWFTFIFKAQGADVMPANHLLTLQMELLWTYVWKMYRIWYHSHQGNFSLDSPQEVLSVHTLAKPLYLWLQWFTPTFP